MLDVEWLDFPVQFCHLVSGFLWEGTGPQWREGKLEPHLLDLTDLLSTHYIVLKQAEGIACVCSIFYVGYLSANEVTTIIPAIANQSLVF